MKSVYQRPPLASVRSTRNRRRILVALAWWEDRILRGIARYAAEHDWELDCRMRWRRKLPSSWAGHGAIAYTGITWKDRALTRLLKSMRVPVVTTHTDASLNRAASVIIPHHEIGKMAGQHLLALKFRHLAFVRFGKNILEEQREEGFRRCVEESGVAFHPLSIRQFPGCLSKLPRPLGLMASNDVNAVHLMRVLLDNGCRIPEEFAIIGVDDTDVLCDFAPVPLTSVRCDFERQGYEAASLLDRLMRGKSPPRKPLVVHPSGVTVRRSTDTIAASSPDVAAALRFLRDHFREPISIRDIDGSIEGSFRQAQRAFRREIGHTMIEELSRLRVALAQELMKDSRRKLEAIAAECGFSSRFHLNQAFQRVTGTSPRAHKQHLLKRVSSAP